MHTTRDPGCEDMLADPLIALMMQSDGIQEDDARALFREVAVRIRERRNRDRLSACCRSAGADHAGQAAA